jgi:glycosyltransferase involved in cell wall biosynthesis
MKKIVYFANIRLPTEKAHGLQIMKTCEAFVGQGVAVELIVPIRKNYLRQDPFDFYKVKRNFTITKISCVDALTWSFFKSLGFWIQTISYYFRAVRAADPNTHVYTRDLFGAWLLSRRCKNVFYELHTFPEHATRIHRSVWQRVRGLIVITTALKTKLTELGITPGKIVVGRDAIDAAEYKNYLPQMESRRLLGLPKNQKIVVYTGHLYEWKGAGMLAVATSQLPTDIHVYLVGGTPDDVQSFKRKYTASNLHIIGWRDHDEMPRWHTAADIVVLPNSAKQDISKLYTSPMKLFEYLVSGTPLIVSDVPSIREVVAPGQAVFCAPDNPPALAEAVQKLFQPDNYQNALVIAKRLSVTTLATYTWKERTKKIKEFIFSISI